MSNSQYVGKWSSFRNFLLKVSHSCEDMLLSCSYGMESLDCMDIFEMVLTDEGICCTFNSVNQKFLLKNVRPSDIIESQVMVNERLVNLDWTPEKGYPPEVKVCLINFNSQIK